MQGTLTADRAEQCYFLRFSKEVLVDESTSQTEPGEVLHATTLKAFVRGSGVTGFPRWRTLSIVQGEVSLM